MSAIDDWKAALREARRERRAAIKESALASTALSSEVWCTGLPIGRCLSRDRLDAAFARWIKANEAIQSLILARPDTAPDVTDGMGRVAEWMPTEVES